MRATITSVSKTLRVSSVVSVLAVAAAIVVPVAAQQRLVPVAGRRLSIDCSGTPGGPATVVLMAGAGNTLRVWERVQPEVARDARVCSYDRAGVGSSDKTERAQSPSEIVDDMHALLMASGERGPYVLVAHSLAGIYARNFEARFPQETAALVLVDASHEEQAVRLDQLDPTVQKLSDVVPLGFFGDASQRLTWRTTLPVTVLRHGNMSAPQGMSAAVWTAYDRIWAELQEDLAKRSPRGELRVAERSGHFIQIDQPELVVQAIRDVMRKR